MHQSINQKLSEKRQQQLHEPRVVLSEGDSDDETVLFEEDSELYEVVCDGDKILLEKVKIVEADAHKEPIEFFPSSVMFASVKLADLICDVDKIPLKEVKIVEADADKDPTGLLTTSIVFPSVKLADLLCNVDKILLEAVKLVAVVLATIVGVSGKPSVVTKDKEGLTVCTLDPIDNVVEVASDTFFEDESTERDFDGAGEVSIAVGMLLDVGSD